MGRSIGATDDRPLTTATIDTDLELVDGVSFEDGLEHAAGGNVAGVTIIGSAESDGALPALTGCPTFSAAHPRDLATRRTTALAPLAAAGPGARTGTLSLALALSLAFALPLPLAVSAGLALGDLEPGSGPEPGGNPIEGGQCLVECLGLAGFPQPGPLAGGGGPQGVACRDGRAGSQCTGCRVEVVGQSGVAGCLRRCELLEPILQRG